MQIKSTTITAAALAALAMPSAALAHDPDHRGKSDDRGKAESRHRGHDRDEQRSRGGDDRHEGHYKGWGKGRKAFVITGVDASGLSVTDGKLTGALTLDPTAANRAARKLLDLTKAEIAGEDTVSFGTAGDAVVVKYHNLTASDALQPTDRVKVFGKVRDGVLDIKFIKVHRPEA